MIPTGLSVERTIGELSHLIGVVRRYAATESAPRCAGYGDQAVMPFSARATGDDRIDECVYSTESVEGALVDKSFVFAEGSEFLVVA